MPLAPIETALDAIRRGQFVIVVDDDDRENEGDMIMAARFITPAAVNFLARYARGLICAPMTGDRLDQLRLPMMVARNRSRMGTAFTVSVEASEGTTTGISAADRARTISVLADPTSRPDDLVSPGHIFPLRAADGGVLARPGHTEAAVDLARLAGCPPAGVLCEVMNDDGTMARLPDLEIVAARHGLHIISIADLIAYRLQHDRPVYPRGQQLAVAR